MILVGNRPLVMGILNITPDSFYDGGRYINCDKAYDRAMAMIGEGADIIDIGGESSRPGAVPVSAAVEIDRVLPLITRIRASSAVFLSIDTCKTHVMQEAITAGIDLVNDITALQDAGALELLAKFPEVAICLMHMQGTPATMQQQPAYERDVVTEINEFFTSRIALCQDYGIARQRLILDPGFGFGKTSAHHLQMLQQLPQFLQHQLPVLLGVSHKSSMRMLAKDACPTTVGLMLAVYAVLNGVQFIRTHDVRETVLVLRSVIQHEAT